MGAAIAAHVTNAGIPVVLLDIVSKDPNDRSAIAKGAVAKDAEDRARALHEPAQRQADHAGNLEDDLELLADCDWIVEAIIENVKIKHDLYAKLETVRKAGSIVTSNTSTIPLKNLIEGRSEAFQKDFAITHFFNPPRYMRLLELVSGQGDRARRHRNAGGLLRRQTGQGRRALPRHAGLHRQPHRHDVDAGRA
jgi:3-hydroxyacyl-CoA dehydrogenase